MIFTQQQIDQLLAVVHEASAAIMHIYNSVDGPQVTLKADDSPLTQADMAAHAILTKGLVELFPHIPVVSEEDTHHNQDAIKTDLFWLVDPIDGTKEFIKHIGEFTVCVGLIEQGKPTFGVVAAPALGAVYYGGREYGAFKVKNNQTTPIRVKQNHPGIVFGSRSHPEPKTQAYISEHFSGYQLRSAGSQLKLTEIAEGNADVYPRLNATLHLWDLAAGHAILQGAGGDITRFDGGRLDYRSADLLVGDFIATNMPQKAV